MGTLVSQEVNVSVNVMERSVTASTNWVMQLVFRIINLRGLSPEHLISKREIIEKGVYVWLAEQKLEGISLEISAPDGTEAIERFDFQFSYQANPDLSVRDPNIARLEEFCRKLETLPSDSRYVVVVHTASGATEISGWYPYSPLPLNATTEVHLSDHGYGHIGTNLVYRGRGK
jgi:hypothetical protein